MNWHQFERLGMVRHGRNGLGIDPPLRCNWLQWHPLKGAKSAQNEAETTPNERKTGPVGGYPGSRVVVVIVITLTLTILLFT